MLLTHKIKKSVTELSDKSVYTLLTIISMKLFSITVKHKVL